MTSAVVEAASEWKIDRSEYSPVIFLNNVLVGGYYELRDETHYGCLQARLERAGIDIPYVKQNKWYNYNIWDRINIWDQLMTWGWNREYLKRSCDRDCHRRADFEDLVQKRIDGCKMKFFDSCKDEKTRETTATEFFNK